MSMTLTRNQDLRVETVVEGGYRLRWVEYSELILAPVGHRAESQVPDLVAWVRSRIDGLNEADPGALPPDRHAVSACLHAIGVMAGWSSVNPSYPRVSSLGEGDLILEWIHGDRELLLFVFADGFLRLHQIERRSGRIERQEVQSMPANDALLEAAAWLG